MPLSRLLLITAMTTFLTACPLDDDKSKKYMWYVDADSDGYGDENDSGTASTAQPSGYVDNNSDCNDDADTGGAINPDATEANDDQIDSDCDDALSKAPFSVGNVGPAGGIIFQTDGANGLEAAPEDQDDGTGAEWGCYNVTVSGADSATDGAQNTIDMLTANCSPNTGGNPLAVDLVSAYSLNGYDDWLLPSTDELNALYSQKAIVGGFASNYYWSSSEGDANLALGQSFDDGYQDYLRKYFLFRVRAIRAF